MLESLDVLSRGIVLGIMLAAPVGPVGIMCIRRTLQRGLWLGFVTGFGAAFADMFFSAVAAFGVTAIMAWIRSYNHSIHIVGGLFLLVVSWHTWHDKPRQPVAEEVALARISPKIWSHAGAAIKSALSSFVVTLTNPATLFGTLAVIATFGRLDSRAEASNLVGGVFLGSSLWWLVLSTGTALVRKHFSEKKVMWINKITAIALAPLALWALAVGVLGNLGYWNAPY